MLLTAIPVIKPGNPRLFDAAPFLTNSSLSPGSGLSGAGGEPQLKKRNNDFILRFRLNRSFRIYR